MKWNEHLERQGEHAFLSASNYHWVNYTPEKLIKVYNNTFAKEEGTRLHEFAATAIERGLMLAQRKKTLNIFVNDCIKHSMEPEQMLFYSENSFGTADAISFRDNVLKIFDFKTGRTRTSFKQLDIYAALFCLEYGVDPTQIDIELRIYQHNEYRRNVPKGKYIKEVMDKIVEFDNIIEGTKL